MDGRKMIKNIITGEKESVDTLIQMYYGDVYAYCYRHLFNKNVAQDITQETFLRFLKNIDSYKHIGKLKNYLYIIAKNIIKDYLKKPDGIYPINVGLETEIYDIENTMLEIEIKHVLDFLDTDERELIILRYYEDMTFADISKILDMPVSTVRYSLKKVEKKIGNKLGGEYR
ncbi:RNA polymerase sigma factor [Faecalicatena orotica]|uniref:RNA polymerase sigma-70 factor (ECF subfamily) n=1 Tax=Faecalicatena orotica TaxID=1544 RepID=A0A2Y9BJJ6_9FIRM|nr:RNA polymerase sigma factor [Faecalicatena orotica]PWJ23430.1 RNA polymerase sigma-70 factor (ECF subfamily) [Faecalicatena orotica]SSA57688.1 RNA polymerase sigma-70 factor, ECF subfamily [Faecalicatena orotica]